MIFVRPNEKDKKDFKSYKIFFSSDNISLKTYNAYLEEGWINIGKEAWDELEAGKLLWNTNRTALIDKQAYEEQLKLMSLRERREKECFRIIDRSNLWYDSLTKNQLEDLKIWYLAWLDVTKTLQIPVTPYWIKGKWEE